MAKPPKPSHRSPEDFAEEICAHLALEVDDLQAEGLSPEKARLAAVTFFASTLPTLRIAKIDPAKTLRED